MKYLKLFSDVPEVSALCLGTVFFGNDLSKEDSFRQMDFFFERGANFFDTARMYADWLPNGHGTSESTLGAWIKDRKCRDRVIVSTKGAHPDLNTMNVGRMSQKELQSDLEESLKTLGIDCIDIYFLHRDDVSRPVEEILGNLESFRKAGKIKHYGCSNWTLARMEAADKAASAGTFEGFSCDQIRFGLADLNAGEISDPTLVPMDKSILAWHEKTKKPVMAYTSSCNGYFSKKLKNRTVPAEHEAVYDNPSNRELLKKLEQWEKDFNIPASALVSAYVMAQDFPSVPISAFSSPRQLEELLLAADFSFPGEIMGEIRKIKRFLI